MSSENPNHNLSIPVHILAGLTRILLPQLSIFRLPGTQITTPLLFGIGGTKLRKHGVKHV